jgi:hypothetical protein
VIVRISGSGQYELNDAGVKRLDELDTALTSAYHDHNEEQFHACLKATIDFVQGSGTGVPDDVIVPSEVIIPPEDTTLDEAERFMTDEGLMQPIPA